MRARNSLTRFIASFCQSKRIVFGPAAGPCHIPDWCEDTLYLCQQFLIQWLLYPPDILRNLLRAGDPSECCCHIGVAEAELQRQSSKLNVLTFTELRSFGTGRFQYGWSGMP